MPQPWYRARWGGDFSREPFDVYKKKEATRAGWLLNSALGAKIDEAGAQRRAADTAPAPAKKSSSRFGLPDLGNVVKAVGTDIRHPGQIPGDVAHLGAEAGQLGLQGISAPGMLTTGAITAPFGKLEVGPGGQVRRKFTAGSALAGLKERGLDLATLGLADQESKRIQRENELKRAAGVPIEHNPLKAVYQQGQQFQESNLPAGVKVGVAGALDPLTYVGPGAVGKLLPKAVAGTRVGRLAGTLLEQPGRVAAGGVAGAAIGAQVAQSTHRGPLASALLPLAGGVAGAGFATGLGEGLSGVTAAGKAPRAGGLSNIPSDIRNKFSTALSREAPVLGAVGTGPTKQGIQKYLDLAPLPETQATPADLEWANQVIGSAKGASKNARGFSHVGLPPGIKTAEDLVGLKQRLQGMMKEGEQGRMWYEKSSQAILDMFGGDQKKAEQFAQLVAIYSPQTEVKTNMANALKAWQKYELGLPIKGVYSKAIDAKAHALLYKGLEWEGRKTNTFYRNLMLRINPEKLLAEDPEAGKGVTVDEWINDAFDFGGDAPTKQQYQFASDTIKKIAEDAGWEPQQVQAAIWTSIKGRGLKLKSPNSDLAQQIVNASMDYADALGKNVAQISIESAPGRTSPLAQQMPGYFDAPAAHKWDYHRAKMSAFLDENGDDIIHKQLGMLQKGEVEGQGVYKGQISPGTQKLAVAPMSRQSVTLSKGLLSNKLAAAEQAGKLTPERVAEITARLKVKPGKATTIPLASRQFKVDRNARVLLDADAALRGVLLQQDGAAWTRVFHGNAGTAGKMNSMVIRLGRAVDEGEAQQLDTALTQALGNADSHGIISTDGGVILANYSDMPNLQFQKLVKKVAEDTWGPTEIDPEVYRAGADGNYFENDWKVNPNGEGYRQRISSAGRPGDFAALEARLKVALDKVDADYIQRYGWDKPGVTTPATDLGGVAAGLVGGEGSAAGVARKSLLGSGTPVQVAGRTAAGAAYGALNPDEGQSRTEGALKYGGLAGIASLGGGATNEVARLSEEAAKAAGKNWQPPVDRASDATVLGLDPTQSYTAEEIKSAYRARMRNYHPDINASDTATQDAQAVNAAFSRLSGGYTARAQARSAPPPPPGGTAGSAAQGPPPGASAGAPPRAAGGAGAATPPPPPPTPPRPASPRVDLFNTQSRAATMAGELAAQGTAKGKLNTALRAGASKLGGSGLDPNLVQDTGVVPFAVKEKNRIGNLINSYEGYADELFNRVENAGIKPELDANGDWRVNNVPFGDIVELNTAKGQAAYSAMSNEQQAAIDGLQEFNAQLNANLRYHGKPTLKWDEFEKAYFPRVVVGKDGVARAHIPGQERPGVGNSQSYEKARTQQSMEEGLANGVDYAHPRQAYRAMVRAKLRSAHDDYLVSRLKPLGSSEADIKRAGGNIGTTHVALPQGVAPGLNGTYFEPETATRINAALAGKDAVSIRPIKAINRALTPFRAMGDISWFAQQGAAMLFRHPGKAAEGGAKVILSALKQPKLYQGLMDQELSRGPGMKTLIEKMGVHITPSDIGELDVGFKPSKIPLAKQTAAFSNETYSRYLNFMRVTFANDAFERAMKSGKTGSELRKELIGAGNAVNRMTGFTGRQPTSLESHMEFAPRFFSSAVEQLHAAVTKGGLEGNIAREHIGRMLVGGALFAYAANKVRGYDTELDPRNSNFLRIRNVGGLDVSLFGTYNTLFRAVAGTALGGDTPRVDALWQLAKGKMSPAVKLIYEPFIAKSDYVGHPVDPTAGVGGLANAVYQEGKSSLPFGLQNLVDQGVEPSIRERSLKPLAGASFGEAVSATGASNAPVTPTEFRDFTRDHVAQATFGKDFSELTGAEKGQVNADPKVAGYQAQANRNTLTQLGDRSTSTKLQLANTVKLDALAGRLESGEITGSQFRSTYHDLQQRMLGSRDVLPIVEKDKELSGWYALYDQATNADGSSDPEKLDALQAEYTKAHPDIQAKVDAVTGTHDNPTIAAYRVAKQKASQYYDIPAYRGMSLEDGKKAQVASGLASRLTSNHQAANTRAAYGVLIKAGLIDMEQAKLAIRAAKLGKNPARTAFEKANPDFDKFYRDAITDATLAGVADIGTFPSGGGKKYKASTGFSAASLPKISQYAGSR